MTTISRIMSRHDLNFLLYEWLDVEELCEREVFREHSRETFDAFLDVAAQIAARDFASHNVLSDRDEPYFDGDRVSVIPEVAAGIKAFNEAGLVSATMDERLGGLRLPHVVERACFVWFQAANQATAAYPMLSMANANLVIAHGSAQQIDQFARPIADGRFSGTMCLSEAHAGSSLADITTHAIPVPDGTSRLFGTKMWISGGDHELSENIVHLVLARHAGGPSGVKGLSLYIVPKYLIREDGARGARNDIATAGLNHKMGYRGIPNTVLNFGEGKHLPGGEPGAVGYLVGSEGSGLSYMFHMMNEARIRVGAGAVALGYTGYLHALEYARARPQGKPLAERAPTNSPVPIIQHPDVRRMLMAAKCYVEGGLALVLFAAHLLDDEQSARTPRASEKARLLLDVLTPIVKSWPSQWCLAANDLAIQIHGGYGYSREYPIEQFYRDNRLNAIHEGTHGIQALDLLGRRIPEHGGAGLDVLVSTMRKTARDARGDFGDLASQLERAVDRVVEVTATLQQTSDRAVALANSTIYLEAVGHVVVAWIWLAQAHATRGRNGAFYEGKRAAAQYFFTYELPRVRSQLDLLERRDTLLQDLNEASF